MRRVDSGYEGTFIEFAETVRDDVAQWGAEYVNLIVKTLMPDGRPFGAVKLREDEELQLYLRLRGDSMLWEGWVTQRAEQIKQLLKESGLDDATILNAHPDNIAQAVAINYSSRMERLLGEEERLASRVPLLVQGERYAPSLPEFESDELGG